MSYEWVIWSVLILFPVLAAWSKYWISFVLFAAGFLVYAAANMRQRDGWEDLANIAMLVIAVGPMYVLAGIVWVLSFLRKRGLMKNGRSGN